jgi:integrase
MNWCLSAAKRTAAGAAGPARPTLRREPVAPWMKIGKMGGCDPWRNTVATPMLENGADIRVIQEMLGHTRISTTELDTRVSINLLKQVCLATIRRLIF